MSVARHTAYNLAGAILPIGVTLITVPLYLKAIGLERYGVLALVWVLAGYFSFFDFGIGRATARKMATLADAGDDARNRLFWTSALISGVLALAAGIFFWPVAVMLIDRMAIPAVLRPELADALPLIILAVPVGILQSLLSGTLEGRRAFGLLNSINVVGNLLTAVLPLAAAWSFGPRLAMLIAATLVARTSLLVAQILACRKIVPLGPPQQDEKGQMRELLSFGGWATVTGVAGPLLVYFDRFAIGAWLGAFAVGFYVIGYNLISQFQVIPNAFARAMFPRLAELSPDDNRARSIDALKVMIALATPVSVIAIFLISAFLKLWLGSEVSMKSAPVTIILLIGFWTNALAFIAFSRLHALGRPDRPAKVHVAELIPYAALLYAGIAIAGLEGAAFAWTLRCTVDFLLLGFMAKLLADVKRELVVGSVLVLIAAMVALNVSATRVYWPTAVAIGFLTLTWSWRVVPASLRGQLLQLLRHPFAIAQARP